MPNTKTALSLPDRWGLKAPFGAIHTWPWSPTT